jgi:2-oxoglutarate ferredoxin oxidoreductase subunit alpha
LLLAIDWHNAERFTAELPMGGDSVAIGDPDAGTVPDTMRESGARFVELPLKRLAKEISGGRPNMVALGAVAALLGIPESALCSSLAAMLGRKGESVVISGEAGMRAGMAAASGLPDGRLLAPAREPSAGRWSITGNEACGLGAIRGGVRFVAAYPITPATELLEWLAPALPSVGGVLVQAEDELASINQLMGASFGGVPSLTATSGPGLALMTETIGLAVASETPVVVVDVMRGGPSTGIPTKSEQSDLNIALYGLHGDAPHVVMAPTTVADCLFTTEWAVRTAESLQTPVIVLSDQALGQARVIIERPADVKLAGERRLPERIDESYQRYAVDDTGVSPMALPGMHGGQHTAEGLEHGPSGNPSSLADDHHAQLDKRERKLRDYDFGEHWALVEGDEDADTAVITWGSCCGPVREALDELRDRGTAVKLVAPRLLAPAQPERMVAALHGVRRLLVVEQTHGAQFYHYLRAYYELPAQVRSLSIPGPLPIRPAEVRRALTEWSES